MQWLLTAVILAAAAWMVSALTYQEDEPAQGGRSTLLDPGRLSLPRVGADVRTRLDEWWRVGGSAVLRYLRPAGVAVVRAARAVAVAAARAARTTGSALWFVLRAVGTAVATVARSAGSGTARAWTGLRGDIADRRRHRRAHVVPQRVPFEKALILTGPEDSGATVGVALPTFNGSAKRPSALSRLLAFVQLVFLVVLWGGGTALAIAGAAWAVTRIV